MNVSALLKMSRLVISSRNATEPKEEREKSQHAFIAILLLLLAGPLDSTLCQALRTDSLSLEIIGVPDTASSFDHLSFRVKYNTTNRDMCLNVSIAGYPVDSLPRNFSNWVHGSGEIAYHHRVPNAQRVSEFYVGAYLTNNGWWSGKEIFVWTYDHRTKILPITIVPTWTLSTPQSVSVDQIFFTSVQYSLTGLQRKSIPNLVVDLEAPDGRIVARQIEWSLPESATYVHRWILPAHVNVASLRLRARLEDERLDAAQMPLASVEGNSFPVLGAAAPDFRRIQFHRDSLFIDKRPAFLHGVNVFSFWNTWDDVTIKRELGKMHDAHLNFARVYIDWSIYQPRSGEWNWKYKQQIATLIRAANSVNIWLELVPVGNWGNWIFDLYSNHWWTSVESRSANEMYFEDFGRLLDSLKAENIYYVSVMQEGSWNFDWFDPLNGEFPKPGAGAIAEADADWSDWLKRRGEPYQTFAETTPELFGRWAGERFADLLYLRAAAFRKGSKNTYAVGAEGTGSGSQYDRRLLGKHTAYYSLPELWAHVVDCLEIHNYSPITGEGYWSGSTGLRSYRAWTTDFRKPVHVGEVNWNYVDTTRLNMGADSTWKRLKEKLELVRSLGYTGYGVWAWMDYDARRLGFLDRHFQARPILDSLARWITRMQTSITISNPNSGLILEQNYPNPFSTGSISVSGKNRSTSITYSIPTLCRVNLVVTDAFGRSISTLVDEMKHAGRYTVAFNASNHPTGVYFYHLVVAGKSITRKMMLVR